MPPPRFKRKKLVVQGIFAAAKQEATESQLEPESTRATQPHKRPRALIGGPKPSSIVIQSNNNQARIVSEQHTQQQQVRQSEQVQPDSVPRIETIPVDTTKRDRDTILPWGISKHELKPASIQNLSDDKLVSFVMGRQKKSKFQLAKELREAKEKAAVAEAAAMYESFAASLDAPTNPNPSADVSVVQQNSQLSNSFAKAGTGGKSSKDNTTTNIFVSNLDVKVDETVLRQVFGQYGPLYSVKILWPRTNWERSRKCNNGFVAFQWRKDAEEAMKYLSQKPLHGLVPILSWGNSVKFKPVAYQDNGCRSQLPSRLESEVDCPWSHRAVWKSSIPTNRSTMREIKFPVDNVTQNRITRLAKFVSRYGAMFEAKLANEQRDNPAFRFLCDQTSEDHLFYRWRVYSFVMNESIDSWRTLPFQFVEGGAWFIPPPTNAFSQFGSERSSHVLASSRFATGAAREREEERRKIEVLTTLGEGDKRELVRMLDNLKRTRSAVGEVMAFCYDRVEAASDCAKILLASLTGDTVKIQDEAWSFSISPSVLLARLYVISDVLHNASAPIRNASAFRNTITNQLPYVMASLRDCQHQITGRMTAEAMQTRVLFVLHVWDEWMLFPNAFLDGLETTYLATRDDLSRITDSQATTQPQSDSNLVTELKRKCLLSGLPSNTEAQCVLEAWLKLAERHTRKKRGTAHSDGRAATTNAASNGEGSGGNCNRPDHSSCSRRDDVAPGHSATPSNTAALASFDTSAPTDVHQENLNTSPEEDIDGEPWSENDDFDEELLNATEDVDVEPLHATEGVALSTTEDVDGEPLDTPEGVALSTTEGVALSTTEDVALSTTEGVALSTTEGVALSTTEDVDGEPLDTTEDVDGEP